MFKFGLLLLESTADINSSMDYSVPTIERFLDGCKTLVFGMLVVFSVLALLWGFLELFRVIFYRPNKEVKNTAAEKEIVETSTEPSNNDEEITAAITAAVYAYLQQENAGSGVKPSFRVVSFKKH